MKVSLLVDGLVLLWELKTDSMMVDPMASIWVEEVKVSALVATLG